MMDETTSTIQVPVKTMTITIHKVPKYFDRAIIEKWATKLAKLYKLEDDVDVTIRPIKINEVEGEPPEEDSWLAGVTTWWKEYVSHTVTLHSRQLRHKSYKNFLETMCHEFHHCVTDERYYRKIEKIKQNKNYDKKLDKLYKRQCSNPLRKRNEEDAYLVASYLVKIFWEEFKKDIEESEFMKKK